MSAKSDGRAEDCVDDYVGKEITIHDNRSICAHAGSCTDGLPSVWRMKQEPWIDPDAAALEEIIAVVKSCPSGALSYAVRDASEDEVDKPMVQAAAVFAAKGGPYAISGDVELTGEAFGAGAEKRKMTLCRCGSSKNKPFCDGAHWNVSFDE